MDQRHYHHTRLKEAREAKGESMQVVASNLNLDRQTIYRAEAGTVVGYDVLVQLCRYYGIPMTEIVVAEPQVDTA